MSNKTAFYVYSIVTDFHIVCANKAIKIILPKPGIHTDLTMNYYMPAINEKSSTTLISTL
jgi:hypothetical protein